MDVYMIVLRLIHVLGGVLWAGAVFFTTLFLQPAVRAAGPDGGKFMLVFGRVSGIGKVMPVAATLTIVSGLLMYWPMSGGLDPTWLATPAGIVLTVSAVLSLAGFLGPALGMLRIQNRMGAIGQAMQAAGGPPDRAQLAEMQGLQARLAQNSKALFVLIGLAVAGMAIARYV